MAGVQTAPVVAAGDDLHVAQPTPSWLEKLIEDSGPSILRLLWRILGREQDVLDAYQDCFCNLATRGRPGDLRSARAYAFRTAANIAIEMLRSRQRRTNHFPRIAAQAPDLEQSISDAPPDQTDSLREAVAQLPSHLRNVVILRDLSQLGYEEVGRILNIKPTTARVYRRHAVVMLAEIMGRKT